MLKEVGLCERVLGLNGFSSLMCSSLATRYQCRLRLDDCLPNVEFEQQTFPVRLTVPIAQCSLNASLLPAPNLERCDTSKFRYGQKTLFTAEIQSLIIMGVYENP